MQIPLWKRLLSHLFEFHIEGTSSEHNPQLDVCLSRGRYQLCTENAIYSFGDLYDNFTLAFQQAKLEQLPGKQVLILGFGLGSIPQILEQKMTKDYHYTGIEIDEEVIYLASKYTLTDLRSSVELICADAAIWVAQSQQRFDLIAIDLFLDDLIPAAFEQIDFLQQVKQLLHPQGLLLYNRLAFTPQDEANAQSFFEGTFQKVFPQGNYLNVKGNWMLVNDQQWIK
ncbi:MAG: methyltransferase domain-containing protein [Bacteroidota bacterium]